jgi:heat shock protein HtpX
MTLYTQISANKRRTAFFLGGFLILVIALGYVFSYVYNNYLILVIVVIIAVVQALVSYYYSDSITLAIAGARPVQKKDNPELYRLVENLAITAGLPTPRIYIVPDMAPNAFATGRDPQHAVVCVTAGLLQILDKQEVEGVVAHEMSHIGNYDIRLMTLVVVLVGVVVLMSDFFLRWSFLGGGRRRSDSGDGQLGMVMLIIALVLAILAPLAATLIQLAISRKREFLADANGALLTRYPDGLASALQKISLNKVPLREANKATAHLYIENPFGSKRTSWLNSLFDTHPPVADRIKVLRQMDV